MAMAHERLKGFVSVHGRSDIRVARLPITPDYHRLGGIVFVVLKMW
jgi:hypothetical protein